MNTPNNLLAVAVRVLTIAVVLVLSEGYFQEARAQGGQGGSAPGTVLPSQIVTLESYNALPSSFECPFNSAMRTFRELFPNGNVSSQPFAVPAGKVLVITSVEALLINQLASNIGANMTFGIARGVTTPLGSNHSPLFFSVSIGTNQRGSTNLVIPNGFVVRPGTDLCLNPAGVGDTSMFVYGFLAPDR